QRQGDSETRPGDAQRETDRAKCGEGWLVLPSDEKRNGSDDQAGQAGPASTDCITECTEQGPDAGPAEQGNRNDQSLLGGAEMEIFGDERCERADDHPHHEADIEVKEGRHERGQMADPEESVARVDHEVASFQQMNVVSRGLTTAA